MNLPSAGTYTFGSFRLDIPARELTRDGARLELPPRVFDTLICLATHPGELLEKDRLLEAVWPGRVVEENNLNQTISALRRLLGESPEADRWILTVPGRGYRFLAPISTGDAPAAPVRVPTEEAGEPPRPASGTGRWLLAGIALVLAAMALWKTAVPPSGPAVSAQVAILPFKSLVASAGDPSLELGMTETLITRLTGTGISVLPLTAVRRFAAREQDARQAGRELGVASVLDASLQRWGDRLRVNVRLVDVADGRARWAMTVDEKFTDLFTVQDAIARRVADSLAPRLDSAQRERLVRRDTQSLDAYQSYLTGQYHLGATTPQSLQRSITLFEEAIRLDPRYARAYAGMAEAYRRLGIAVEVRPTEVFPKVEAAARRALELDPTLAEPHLCLGYVRFWFDWDWAAAEAEFRRSIELDPQSAFPYVGLAQLQVIRGRFHDALPEMARAREREPLSLIINTLEAWYLLDAADPAAAHTRLQRALDIDPNFWVAHWVLGDMAFAGGDTRQAIEEYERAHASSQTPQIRAVLAHAKAVSGDRGGAQATLDEMESLSERTYVPPTAISKIYAGLGELDAAFEALERAYAERDGRLTFLSIDLEWRELRDDPRFGQLRRRLNLE